MIQYLPISQCLPQYNLIHIFWDGIICPYDTIRYIYQLTKNMIWTFYYWTFQWNYYFIDGYRHLNGEQSIISNERKALFGGDTDVMVTQTCYGHFKIRPYLNDCGTFESMYSLCITAIGSLITESIYRSGSMYCYTPTGITRQDRTSC